MITRKSISVLAGVLLASATLSGCVGGTTYGTGVAQEEATIEDLANILSVSKKKKARIDYDPRPDLVVPKDKQLVEPTQAAADDQNWPESPEERLATIRREADEAQQNTADQNNFSRSKKLHRNVKPGEGVQISEAPIGQGIPNVSCDPHGEIMRACTPGEISRAVRSARQEIASVGKTGYQRRYLTEPPLEYRTPSENAVAGDEGYSAAELRQIDKQREERDERWETLNRN